MKILILSQWCFPEPELKALTFAKQLTLEGHKVQILTGFPNYPGGKIYDGYKIQLLKKEKIESIEIIRVALFPSHDNSGIKRIANYLSFAFFASVIGTFTIDKADIVYVYHPPPTVSIPAFFIKHFRKIPIVYDMQDLWPESLANANSIKKSNWVVKIAEMYLPWMYKQIDKIVVQSYGFRTKLIERGVDPQKIQVVYNWSLDADTFKDIPSQNLENSKALIKKEFSSDQLNILFAGNIGEGQSLETIIYAAKMAAKVKIKAHFFFLGDGIRKFELEKLANSLELTNITFLQRVSPVEAELFLNASDWLLVHLKKMPYFEVTIPSKIQAYLKVGKPILIGVEGEAAELVKKARAGIQFEPENPKSLFETLISISKLSKGDTAQMGQNGSKYYKENLSLKIGTKKFVNIFKKTLTEIYDKSN